MPGTPPTPAPPPNGFSPASGPITTLAASAGTFGSTVLASSSAADFIVLSASQPATPVLSSQANPAGIAQFQITATESAGIATQSAVRAAPASLKTIAEAHVQAASEGFRELPPAATGIEAVVASLPRLPESRRSPASIRTTKANLGDQRVFKVLYTRPGSTSGSCPNPVPNYTCYVNVTATLMTISQYGYVWVDNTALGNAAEFPDPSYFAAAGANFDRYFAIETQAFGPPWSPANLTQYGQCDSNANPLPKSQYEPIPDMTGADPHVHILITDVLAGVGEGGYFYSGNFIAQNVLNCSPIPRAVSNELPMLVIGGANYPPATGYSQYNPQYWLNTDMPRSLSHELQHFLHNMNKYFGPLTTGRQTILDSPWIDEGCSMLAEDLAANGMQIDTPIYTYVYLLEPSQFSLTSFVGYQPNPLTGTGPYGFYYYTAGNYGAAYLFVRYLYDRFGGAAALHALYADFRPATPGLSNVNPVLAAAGNSETWPQLFGEWTTALAAQSTGVTNDPRYGFNPAVVLRGPVQVPSRRNPPLQVRNLVLGGPQPPEAFDSSGNLTGYVTLSASSSPTVRALDGAANFFIPSPLAGGATIRTQTGTLNASRGALVQGNLPTPMPTSF